MSSGIYKTIQIKPLNGLLNTRSIPEDIPFGGYRWLQNVSVTSQNRICRARGIEKFFAELLPYNNQDLHDQLFTYNRQPINMLLPAISEKGLSTLFAGTQNRLYDLDGTNGNWRVISDQLGGPATFDCVDRAWRGAQLKNVLLFSNGVDEPVYHVLGQPSIEPGNQAVSKVKQLQDIGVSKAQVVVAWQGMMILGNVVMDGVRADDRVVWSDFQKGLSWKPSKKSIAGFHDLGQNESILAMLPLGDVLEIYTTKSIWQATVVGGDQVLGFQLKYVERRGSNACLAYANTLISLGDEHLYFGRDGIYLNSPYLPKPTRVEWIHEASGVIFDDINSGLCYTHCGGYDSLTKTAWFSWARKGETCNQQTMRFNTQYPFADYAPMGFSAFAMCQPDRPKSLRQWLIENCICSAASLDGLNLNPMEGGFCPGSETDPVVVCLNPPTSIYTPTHGLDMGGGKVTEDFDFGKGLTPDEHSLSALLGSQTVDSLCGGELSSQECNAAIRFVMVSTEDNCIKETSDNCFIEVCTSFTPCGQYRRDGYETIIRSGPTDLRAPSDIKNVNRFLVDLIADIQAAPSMIHLRIGASYQAADPNTDECSLIWREQKSLPMTCPSGSGSQLAAAGLRSNTGIEWPLYIEGRFLFWELRIDGTGGGACFGSVSFDVAMKPSSD